MNLAPQSFTMADSISGVSGDGVAGRVEQRLAVWASIGRWGPTRWAVAVVAAVAAGLVMGVPTGVVQTDFYTRMTPVTWWDYPVLAVSAVLAGLIAATYVRAAPRAPVARRGPHALGGMLLSSFAIGCPVCNKIIVAALGVSGALSYWAPLQPVLGVASIALLLLGLNLRLHGEAGRRLPAAAGNNCWAPSSLTTAGA